MEGDVFVLSQETIERFKVTEEFFGGLIHDKITKQNYSVDDLTYNTISVLAGNTTLETYKQNVKEDLSADEMIGLLQEMVDIGLFKNQCEMVANQHKGQNHLSYPLRVFYDITYGCNLRCKHCFTNSGICKNGELTMKEKRMLVDQCKELGIGRISIAGGEPMYSKDFLPFIEYCKLNGVEVSFTTNGTLFTEENIHVLNKYDIKTITVSLDGGNEESSDFIRGTGSFKKTVEGLKLLNKYYHGNYSVKTTLMKTNVKEIEQIINISIECGCKSIKFNCVREDGRAKTNREGILLDKEMYTETVKNIEHLKKKYNNLISLKAPLNVYCNEDYDFIPELGFGCFAAKESFCVDPLGNVKPCSHFPKEFICGNIKEKCLFKIWHTNSILEKFRSLEGNTTCNSCEQYMKCRGGCRFRAYNSKDLNAVDPFCYLDDEL